LPQPDRDQNTNPHKNTQGDSVARAALAEVACRCGALSHPACRTLAPATPASKDRSIIAESSSSRSRPTEFALVRTEKVAEVLARASFGRRGVSAARTALGRARRPRMRHRQGPPAPFRAGLTLPTLLRPLTFIVGIRAPAPRLQPRRRQTRTLRAAAPAPGLGARAYAPGTSAALPDPTIRIVSAQRSSRELGPLRLHPCVSSYAAARVDRASAPPKLHRQHFARSSYRCGIPLTGSCNSIFKDEHPSLHRLLRPRGQSELRAFTTLGSLRRPATRAARRFLPLRKHGSAHL
jgi:hypothetical protein